MKQQKSAKNTAKTELIHALVKKDLESLASGDVKCCGGIVWCK